MTIFGQMQVCNGGHEEIVYLGKSCPGCLMLQEIEELTKERDRLQEEKDQHECNP